MIKKLKIAIVSLMAVASFGAPALVPVAVHAQADIQGSLCQGAELQAQPGQTVTCTDPNGSAATQRVNDTIALVINVFSLVVGVVAVIMIIIGGLRYIISGGDSGNVTSAKNTILYAIIGLVVVALSQFIVKFVLGKVSS